MKNRILKAIDDLGDGRAATWAISENMKLYGPANTGRTRRAIKKMEKEGLVEKHPKSVKNNSIWMRPKK